MSKIIKVSADLKVTVHEFQKDQLCELIGGGCEMVENVMPKRLYRELGHTTTVQEENSKCVSMLVDESFLCRNNVEPNLIGCYLYETDKHGYQIMGNILFVGNTYGGYGIDFIGIEPETFKKLYAQLEELAAILKAHKEEFGA